MMGLAPKNWSAFQHYKDRAPAWIKLHRGLLDDYEFHCLPVASKALAPCLWLLASEYEGGQITAPLKAIAFRLRMSEDELRTALKPLVDSGFFIDASGMLADCKRDAIPEREEQVKTEVEKNTRTVAKATRPRAPANDDFEEFKKAYPKRDGGNPWPPARKLFEAAVKAGEDPKRIIAAARAGTGIDMASVGTRFVPQAETWLRKRCYLDYLNGTEADLKRRAEADLMMEARGYFWSDDAGKWMQRPQPPPHEAETPLIRVEIPALKRA
jgi:hypothetical protein